MSLYMEQITIKLQKVRQKKLYVFTSKKKSKDSIRWVPYCDFHEDCKMVEVDPFKHQLQLTKWDWLRTYFLGIFLVPTRIVIFLIALISMSVISKIALVIHCRSNNINEPFTSYWMKSTQKIVIFLWRTALRICGLSATIKGEQVPVIEAPIIIFAPHSTFFDLIIGFGWANTFSVVIAEEYAKVPIIGSVFQLFQPIYVKRDNQHAREIVKKEILSRTSSVNKGWSQLGLPQKECVLTENRYYPISLGLFTLVSLFNNVFCDILMLSTQWPGHGISIMEQFQWCC